MSLDIRYPAISDLRARARARVPHFVFEYLDSATGIEDQHKRNRDALKSVQLMPGILAGPMAPDLSTTFLGRDYHLPFGCAPVGMSGIMWPRAEKILSAACAKAGLPYTMSTTATVEPEDLAPYIGDQGWFQMYMPSDKAIRADMLDRATKAGFHTLVLTVDVPVDSRRERQRRANLQIPPRLNAQMIWSMMTHPSWTLGTLKEGIPSLKFGESYVNSDDKFDSMAHAGHIIRGQPAWSDIDELRELWKGPMIIKGILKPEDAKRLVDKGADAIWVSNHTGRQFDGGPTSIHQLPKVRAAIPETPIIFDSGVTNGTDILRALALGADFVMMGRAWHYAVGALGEAGPPHLMHILKDDIELVMGNLCTRTLADLKDALIRPDWA